MDDFTFETAAEADIAGIQFTAEESWRATYRGIFPDAFIDQFLANAYSKESLTRAIKNPRTPFLVAKEDGVAVVAFCQYGPSLSGEDMELYRLYVDPDYWRLGLGGRLLEMLESDLRAKGVSRYFCYVHALNEVGKAFYLKRGFVHEATRDKSADQEWCMEKTL